MIMKVFQKGQVVIPAAMRKALGIQVGEGLVVRLNVERKRIELSKPAAHEAAALAGSLLQYRGKRSLLTREAMARALAQGLGHEP